MGPQGIGAAHRFSSFTMVLPVNDEESRVARAISYYARFAPLLVVDNFSRDRSAEIARELGAEVAQYRNAGTIQTPEWMRHVAGLVGTDHFLLLSCSEFLPVALLQRFDEIARARAADVVSFARQSYTCGELIPLWGSRSAGGRRLLRVERFFDRRGLDFDRVVIHGPFLPTAPSRRLDLPPDEGLVATHLRDSDAVSLLLKHAEYASVEALDRLREGRPTGLGWLVATCAYELANFVRVGPAHWTRLAAREVWARMAMHAVTYWTAWEQRTGATLAASRVRSDALWRTLAAGTAGLADEPSAAARREERRT